MCSTLTRIAQNDFYPIMYMHISCVGLCVHGFMNLMPSWFVCGFLFCFVWFFFSDVLTYCTMLQAFICYCSFVRCFWCACACVCVCVCVCVLFIGIVQRNWVCLRWKSAIEIELLLLLLLLLLNPKNHWHWLALGHLLTNFFHTLYGDRAY